MGTRITLDLQRAVDAPTPSEDTLRRWVESAYMGDNPEAEVTLRIVDLDEMRALNHQFRGKDKPTNVLSFPFESPPGIEIGLLGDIIISAKTVQQEALDQNKTLDAHWAHMVIHGMLHLQGYDHLEAAEAEEMESLETTLVTNLGFPPPYASG